MAAPLMSHSASNSAFDHHSHHRPHHSNTFPSSHHGHEDNNGHHRKNTNAITKLVGRLRSASNSEASTPASTPANSNSPYASDSDSRTGSAASSIHRMRSRTPSFKLRPNARPHPTADVTGGTTIAGDRHPPHGSHHHHHHPHLPSFMTPSSSTASVPSGANIHNARDAPQSLELWTEAYDYLRDNPRTGGLVVAYEGIVSQGLPEHLKVGGLNTTLRDYPDSKRLELVSAITNVGLMKRRQSKSSQISDESRAIVNTYKDAVTEVLSSYPSAALAWCGFCTLTPLLMDPVFRRPEMRKGLLHITGRIAWYMHLTRLLQRESWLEADHAHPPSSQSSSRSPSQASSITSRERTREAIYRLYRKVLEFQMVCVCATASAWNTAAKNVVDWQGLASLNATIAEMDAELRSVVEGRAAGPVKGILLTEERDLDVDEAERREEKEQRGRQGSE